MELTIVPGKFQSGWSTVHAVKIWETFSDMRRRCASNGYRNCHVVDTFFFEGISSTQMDLEIVFQDNVFVLSYLASYLEVS